MRRFFTLFMALVCFVVTQNVSAQSCTVVPNPTTTPTYGTPPATLNSTPAGTVPVNSGWYSNQAGTVGSTTYLAFTTSNAIPGVTGTRIVNQSGNTNGTYRLYSPNYYFNSAASTIKFYIALNTNNESGSINVALNNVAIYYGASAVNYLNSTALCSYNSSPLGKNTIGYYEFTITLPSAFPSSTNFRIGLDMVISSQSSGFLYISEFGVTGSTAANSAAGALPVHFSKVAVNKAAEAAVITWNVGTEQNVSGYDVEKSTDGRSFTKIGYVAAAGLSSYSFADTKAGVVNFYRVKSVDVDGKYSFSTVVALNNGAASVVVKAFMSDRNTLTVQHEAAEAGTRVMVSSMDGRIVKSRLATAGSQQTTVDLSSTPTGLYIVRYDNVKGGTQSIKFIK